MVLQTKNTGGKVNDVNIRPVFVGLTKGFWLKNLSNTIALLFYWNNIYGYETRYTLKVYLNTKLGVHLEV